MSVMALKISFQRRRRLLRLTGWALLLLRPFFCLAGSSALESLSPAKAAWPEAARAHWAFQPVRPPSVPEVRQVRWVRTPVDGFVLADLERAGLAPNPAADRVTWLRRVTLDLIGLPPTVAEVNAFLADASPGAPGRVVDRLLASPQYGERWARDWLDLARYADSEGFKADETRPYVWRYRDYVIESFNEDKPYDRFVQEQLAADELWPAERRLHVATAFSRHYPDESNARNLRQRRQEILNDITDTVGSVFLGLSYGCARCHDHKYDPILQSDYYRLQAFFANTAARDGVLLAPGDAVRAYEDRRAVWDEKTRAVRNEIETIAAPHRRAIEKDYRDKYPPEIQAILAKPEGDRSPFERQMAWKARQYLDRASHEYIADDAVVTGRLKGEARARWDELHRQLKCFAPLRPAEPARGSVMADLGPEAPPTFVLNRGLYDQPAQEVQPGLLQILYPDPVTLSGSPGDSSSGRRSALARLITDPANPLTARVIVNRVWQHHFGRGLVGTPSDFGLKGERPTHPALLDWLANDLVSHGWSLKRLHRMIALSSTYGQSSSHREEAARVDPGNRLWWKYGRHRLEAEVIRDAALQVSGSLNPAMGGPGIFPELPVGMPTPRGGWAVSSDESARDRRSIYVFVRRNTRYPMFDSFDQPDPHESCARRNVTTGPLQALTLLNSHLLVKWSRRFAERVHEVAGDDEGRQVEMAYRIAFGRRPAPAEQRLSVEFLRAQRSLTEGPGMAGADDGKKVSGQLMALADLCHTLMNANEFLYVD